MPPDKEYAALMFQSGLRDFKAMQGMLRDTEVFEDAIFGFHAQQCCEKFLKAALSQLGEDYDRTHDLYIPWKRLQPVAQVPSTIEFLISLSPFAVQGRYENVLFTDLPLKRDTILEQLTHLKQWLLDDIKIQLSLLEQKTE